MRPILLKIKGLNSFIEEQTIDFARLMEPGLFGIFGPTGSGKTTILDGITLALYGEIARKSKNFININCKSASVVFEFQISGAITKRYRVEREFKQDANREGYKTGKCRLTDITEDESVILADKVTDINHLCIEIIGLKVDDFQRTVVLPQGRFSEFLKLEGRKRSEMLERLFRLQPYGDELNRKLKEKSDEISHQHSNIEGQLKAYEELSEEKLEETNRKVQELSKQLKEKQEHFRQFTKQYESGKEIWNLQLEQQKHNARKAQLEQQAEEMTFLETRIKLSQKANKVYPYIKALEQTSKDVVEKQRELAVLKEKSAQSEERKTKIEQEFLKWKEARERESPSLRLKLQGLKEAIGYQMDYHEAAIQNQKNMEEYNTLEKEWKKAEKEENRLKNSMDDSNAKLEKLQEEQNKYEISAQIRQQIQLGIGLEQQLVLIEERIAKMEIEYNKAAAELKEKEEQLSKVQQILSFTKQPEIVSIGEYQDQLLSIKEKKRVYDDALLKMEKNVQELRLYAAKLEELKKDKETLNRIWSQKKEQKSKLEVEMLSYKLRQELQNGKPCPVCGSIHHENMEFHKADEKQYERLQEECRNLEKQVQELEKQEFGINSNQDRLQTEQKELEDTVTKFKFETDPLSDEEIEEKLKILPEYQPLKIAVEMLNASLKQMNDNMNDDKKTCNKLKEQLKELIASVSYPSFGVAAEKVRLCDEMLEEIKDTMQKERELIAQRRREHEECLEKQNRVRTELAVLAQTIRTANETLQVLRKKFDECLNGLEDMSIEDASLEQKKQILEKREKEIEDAYVLWEEQKELEQARYVKLHEKFLELNSACVLIRNLETQQKEKAERMRKEQQFASLKDCLEAVIPESVLQEKETVLETYRAECAKNKGVLLQIEEQIQGRSITKEEWNQLVEEMEESEKAFEELKLDFNHQKQVYARMLSDWKKLEEIMVQKKKIEHQESLLADLTQLFRGKKFVEYVAYSKLKYISQAASHRLKEISHGNYGLELAPLGKFVVCDYKNGGVKRDASTLSGGETFLVSLSLALALSEQVQLKGTAPLELFFLDEGFGTLDEELLEVVMSSLERIQNKRLTVGIISHVEAVKNRVPIKLLVSPSVAGMGGTKVHIEKN